MKLKISLRLYDLRWNTLFKDEAIIDVDRRFSRMGSKIKSAITPILWGVKNAAKNHKEKKPKTYNQPEE